jgi:hypothetical protein
MAEYAFNSQFYPCTVSHRPSMHSHVSLFGVLT